MYRATALDVDESMAKWGCPPEMRDQVKAYREKLVNESYFATALKMPMTWQGVNGIMLAVSSPQSTAVSKENARIAAAGGIITEPEWLYYEVWWFAGLAFLNWAGILETKFQGHQLSMLLGDFIDGVCLQKGMADWKERYCRIGHGFYRQSLRELLVSLGIVTWAELTCGLSWRGYAALDVYLRVFAGGMAPPEEEAWYLLNTEYAPQHRQLYNPEYWYMCKFWQSFGQRPCIAEWFIHEPTALMRMAFGPTPELNVLRMAPCNPITQRRMLTVMNHLTGIRRELPMEHGDEVPKGKGRGRGGGRMMLGDAEVPTGKGRAMIKDKAGI